MRIFYGFFLAVSVFANYLGFDSLSKGRKFDAILFFMAGLGALMIFMSRLLSEKIKKRKK